MKVYPVLILSGLAVGAYVWQTRPAEPVVVRQAGPLPAQTALTPTPRARFTPTPATRRGYYNIDVVGDFTLPATKSITFSGAGRNLHVNQDWSKLFRRGFSSIAHTNMVRPDEIWVDGTPPAGWKSRLAPSQRALILYGQYFADAFGLEWARNSEKAPQTVYRAPDSPNARPNRNTAYQSASELSGGCVGFGDCPPGDMKSTFGKIYVDIENNGTSFNNRQEHANLYVFLTKTLKENVSPQTEVGWITPWPHNCFGYSRAADYQAGPDWLWTMPARQTATSRPRGMPDAIVGQSFGEVVDFQMPGTYYVYPDLDYNAPHTGDGDRHWLAGLLSEQEINRKLSPKKRIAWQWLFNTQADFPGSHKAEHPAPPAIAEGMGIFYWFTGAYGTILWDDQGDLTPDQPRPADPEKQNIGNDRNYTCYEHYLHGLWRLFKHHGDLFNGRETYLNEATECSYDGGQTWVAYNANQLKTRDVPFARVIVNGDQILVAATKPYARPGQPSSVMVRYMQNGYEFYTTITLTGDQIFLGRATMRRAATVARPQTKRL